MVFQVLKSRSRFFTPVLVFITIWYFTLGMLPFGITDLTVPQAKAAALTWVGGTTGNWETASNWSSGAVPTANDTVTISSSTNDIVVTLSSGQTANFSSLTVGGDNTKFVTTTFIGNIGSGVSTTIATHGIISQANTIAQVLSGNFTIQSGGVLTHRPNSTSVTSSIIFNVNNFNVQTGGVVDANGVGYSGGAAQTNGNGTGGGTYTSDFGGGGGYGGNGGAASNGAVGGNTNGATTTPENDAGSGGAGGTGAIGGYGGGIIKIVATSTLAVNGTIRANGNAGVSNCGSSAASGGGAGGGIRLESVTFSGSGSITANGGAGGNAGGACSGGGGSGGRVLISADVITYSGSTTVTGGTVSGAAVAGHVGTTENAPNAPAIVFTSDTTAQSGSHLETISTTTPSFSVIFNDPDVGDTATKAQIQISTSQTFSSIDTWDSGSSGNTITTCNNGSRCMDLKVGNFGTAPLTTRGVVGIAPDVEPATGGGPSLYSPTTYYTRIRFFDAAGAPGPFTTTTNFFTQSLVVPAAPSRFERSTLTKNTVGFTWTDNSAIESRFLVQSSLDGIIFTTSTQPSADATSVASSSLLTNTQYTFRIKATGSTNDSTYVTSTFYTLADTPSAPSRTANGQTSVTVNWTGASNPSGTLYNITDANDSSRTSGWISDTSYTFTGLSSGTTYNFHVRARNGDGVETDNGQTASIVTDSGGAPAPTPPPAPPAPLLPLREVPKELSLIDFAPTGLITVDSGIYTNTPDIHLKIDATYAPEFALKESDREPSSDFSEVSFRPVISELPWKLQGVDGKKCINARFNSKEKQFRYDTFTCVILDTSKPSAEFSFDPDISETGNGIVSRPRLHGVSDSGAKITITIRRKQILKSSGLESPSALFITPGILRLAGDTGTENVTINANKDGTWSYTLDDSLPAGDYTVSVQIQDLAGNVSAPITKDVVIKQPNQPVQPVEPKPVEPEQPAPKEPVVTPETPVVPPPSEPKKPTPAMPPPSAPIALESADNQNGTGLTGGSSSNLVALVTEPEDKNVAVAGSDDSSIFTQPIQVVTEAVTKLNHVASSVNHFVKQPAVQKANVEVAVPATAAAGVLNASVGFQLPQLFNLLRYLFGQPTMLWRRRKQKSWGVVYSSYSKLPVDLATIRLIDGKTGRVVSSQVTDFHGRYFMSVDQGHYRLEIIKPGFVGFSEHLKGKEEDTKYTNLYHGEAFYPPRDQFEINYNIPLDPVVQEKPTAKILRDHAVAKIQFALSLTGMAASLMSFVVTPDPLTGGFILLHVGLFTLFYKLSHHKLPGSWGTIRSFADKSPLGRVVVRVFDSAYNKLVNTTVSDNQGRYALLVGPSVYFVTYEKAGFASKQSPVLDYSKGKTGELGGLINRDEILETIHKK